jgi:hypothetical protein
MPKLEASNPDLKYIRNQEFNRGVGLCVIKTLNSLLSKASGENVYLNRDVIKYRIDQMKRAEQKKQERSRNLLDLSRLRRPLTEQKLFAIVGRLDQFLVKDLLTKLAEKDPSTAAVLSDCDIKFEKADLEDALNLMEAGYQVGVIKSIPHVKTESAHMFHLGVGEGGDLYNLSDHEFPIMIKDYDHEALNKGMKQWLEKTGGWNLIALRKENQSTLPDTSSQNPE